MTLTKFDFLVIFGATGDLVERKVIPSLYHLFTSGKINSKDFRVFAFARRDFTNGKYDQIIDNSLKAHFKNPDFKTEADFYSIFEYVQGDLNNRDSFVDLNKKILKLEDELKICANKLFYLAIPPILYNDVITHIHKTQFDTMCKGAEVKVMIEKPFGKNLETFLESDNVLKQVFAEKQIYRIDHYLGKQIIRDIAKVKDKFADRWNTENIDRIFISTTETLGVEERGEYFDSVGALRDVGQNHLLEVIALIASEEESSTGRASVLNKLVKYTLNDMPKYTFRAQYKGYKNIDKVDPNSTSETYFKVAAFIDDPKWKYTKFIIESGKRTGQERSFIEIDFKNKEKLFINFSRENPFIRLFNGNSYTEITTSGKTNEQYVLEYSTMIEEALMGKQDYFIDQEEVKAQWNFIDPIINAWQNNAVPLFTYMPDDISVLSIANI